MIYRIKTKTVAAAPAMKVSEWLACCIQLRGLLLNIMLPDVLQRCSEGQVGVAEAGEWAVNMYANAQ